MNEIINSVYVQGGIVMLVVNFILTGLKKVGMRKKLLPFFALFLPAIAGAIYALAQSLPIIDTIIQGLIIGATSMGAYDVVKKVKERS